LSQNIIEGRDTHFDTLEILNQQFEDNKQVNNEYCLEQHENKQGNLNRIKDSKNKNKNQIETVKAKELETKAIEEI